MSHSLALSDNSRADLMRQFRETRRLSEWLCEPLFIEDYGVQSMPEVSPPKWHLAHTSWFFEHFILKPFLPGFEPYHPLYGFLFNSYYKAVGPHLERTQRGNLSRPTVQEIYQYRHAIDEQIMNLLCETSEMTLAPIAARLRLGLEHEQQHQELLLTDIKHILWSNPLRPSYFPSPLRDVVPAKTPRAAQTLELKEGIVWIGADEHGEAFSFDNERPAHRVFLEAFEIESRSVNCGEYLEFIEAGGYRDPPHWLSEGWDECQKQKWQAPLYWEKNGSHWNHYTLAGTRSIDEQEPVTHISYFEADAYARWRGRRLPTESEWECAAGSRIPMGANLADKRVFHPEAPSPVGPSFYGNGWEWTSSAYAPYPGFKPLDSALGEYNGKFMCSQYVLRGGSCATVAGHLRPTYRNFFAPETRWQFSGVRLAL